MKNLKFTLICALIKLTIAGCGSARMENPSDQPGTRQEEPSATEEPEVRREEPSATQEPELASTYVDYRVLAIQSSRYEQDAPKDYVITSMSEFESFQERYPEICGGKDFMETFHTEIKGYFIDNTLVCHMETVGSGSIVFEITGVSFDENHAASIEFNRIDPSGAGTCDMATWFMFAEIPNGDVQEAEGLSAQDIEDMSVVDEAMIGVLRTEEFINASVADRKNMAEEMLKELEEQGLICNVYFDEEDMFSFQYKCGVLGGVDILLDSERYYVGGEPIN